MQFILNIFLTLAVLLFGAAWVVLAHAIHKDE